MKNTKKSKKRVKKPTRRYAWEYLAIDMPPMAMSRSKWQEFLTRSRNHASFNGVAVVLLTAQELDYLLSCCKVEKANANRRR